MRFENFINLSLPFSFNMSRIMYDMPCVQKKLVNKVV